MPFFKPITISTMTCAALCVLAIPIWAMGVPGVENQYAKGWKMGLNVLLVYPLAWLATYAPYFAMHKRLGNQNRNQWQAVTGALAIVIALIALFRLIQSFKTML